MFSILERASQLEKLKEESLDLIIVGGGITGAGIAIDAAQRGMKVALFEKGDFASGTSSKSTKLVHGGLRYLKQLEFSLVKEVGIERAIVHKNARHLVVAEKMILPIIKNGSLNKFFTNIALLVYDFLAGVEKNERRRMLSKKETIKEEPLFYGKGKDVIGGGLYYEYRTDDARLTLEILKKAHQMGVYCFNYAEVKNFNYKNETITGVHIKDLILEKEYNFDSLFTVNAAGPWVDKLRKIDKSIEGKRLLLTKGVHIVVNHKKLAIKHAVYFDAHDDRMIFAIPRNGKTYIGTTDTVYNQDINNPKVNKEDVVYLLKSVNKMFPAVKLNEKHIVSSWAGLRPLIYEDGKSASEVSRKDEIFISKSGLISIAGGKLTGYRKMAEKTVDLIRLKLIGKNKTFGKSNTSGLKVSGAKFNNNEEITDLIIQLSAEAKQINLSQNQIKEWVYRYGSNTPQLLKIAFDNFNNKENNTENLALLAEIIYTIENEMLATISDFYIRRTSKLYFDRNKIEKTIDFVCLEISTRLKLNKAQIDNQRAAFMQKYNDALDFE